MSSSSDSIKRDSAGRRLITCHAEVVAVATDPDLFSNAVSTHLQVPNGLDGEEHAAARRALNVFFTPESLAPLIAQLDAIASVVIHEVGANGATFDAVADLGGRYAVRAQSVWLGWPASFEAELIGWVGDNRAATRSGDRTETARVAAHFDDIIQRILASREGDRAAHDTTAELLAVRIDGERRFTREEIVSILRNWTGGDLASLALCAGVVIHWLATHEAEQRRLASIDDDELDAVIDEILRIDDPFVSNRRVATRAAQIGGCPVAAGEQVVLRWREANRDPAVFPDPDGFAPHANRPANLVWGIGVHDCPGRPLATAELRQLIRSLWRAGLVVSDGEPQRELAPAAGYRSVPVRLIAH